MISSRRCVGRKAGLLLAEELGGELVIAFDDSNMPKSAQLSPTAECSPCSRVKDRRCVPRHF